MSVVIDNKGAILETETGIIVTELFPQALAYLKLHCKEVAIKEAAKIHGSSSHKTLIDNLPAGISYGEIRLVLAAGQAV